MTMDLLGPCYDQCQSSLSPDSLDSILDYIPIHYFLYPVYYHVYIYGLRDDNLPHSRQRIQIVSSDVFLSLHLIDVLA